MGSNPPPIEHIKKKKRKRTMKATLNLDDKAPPTTKPNIFKTSSLKVEYFDDGKQNNKRSVSASSRTSSMEELMKFSPKKKKSGPEPYEFIPIKEVKFGGNSLFKKKRTKRRRRKTKRKRKKRKTRRRK